MNLLNLSIIFLFVSANIQSAQPAPEFFSQPGSKVLIEGTSNYHDWRVEGKEIEGTLKPGADFPFSTNTQPLKAGEVIAKIEGSIPVRSLHDVTHGTPMDAHVHFHLKEDSNPRIRFRFKKITLKTLPLSENAPFLFESQVEVVAAGVTNQLTIPVSLFLLANENLRLVGSTPATFSSFGIAPELGFSPPAIRIPDEIKLSFDWRLSTKTK